MAMSRSITSIALILFAVPASLASDKSLVPGSLAGSDVILRTLAPQADSTGQRGTISAAEAFGANRIEWIYEVDQSFAEAAHKAGLLVGGSSLNGVGSLS
jgi:hypothetical protein